MRALFLVAPLFIVVLASCAPTGDSPIIESDEDDLGVARQAQFCINNLFPGPGDEGHKFSFIPCQGEEELLDLDATTGANLWSYHVTAPGMSLGFLACSDWQETRLNPAPITNLSNVTAGSSPALAWSHFCSHVFLVKRKVGAGAWTTIATIANGSFSSNSVLPYSYTDTTVSLSVPHEQIQYVVVNKNYASESEIGASGMVSFPSTLPLSSAIAGPTEVLIPAKGKGSSTITWTASVSGGSAPYSYQWIYRGFAAGTAPSFSNLYKYVGYNADFSSTLKLTVTDAAGTSKSTTITIVEDSAPYDL